MTTGSWDVCIDTGYINHRNSFSCASIKVYNAWMMSTEGQTTLQFIQLLFVCVCMSVQCVCGMWYAGGFVCVHMKAQRVCLWLSTYSLRQSLSENLELGWCLSSPIPPLSPSTTVLGLQAHQAHPPTFMWVLGSWTQVFIAVQPAFLVTEPSLQSLLLTIECQRSSTFRIAVTNVAAKCRSFFDSWQPESLLRN